MSCKQPIFILLLIAVVIFIYFSSMMLLYSGNESVFLHNDPLNYKLFNFNLFENCCSSWPLTHFFLFLILGFLYPHCWKIILLLGILWELFEISFSWLRFTEHQWVRTSTGIEYSQNWFAGSFKDIIFNFAGFGVGVLLSKIKN